MRIHPKDIERVLDATSIEDIISEFVPLTGNNKRFTACCPFPDHNDKNPSFVVTPHMGIYKCFSCGKSGNVITFLKEHQGMSFVEAIQYLAKRANMTLHTDDTPLSAEEQEAEIKREAAIVANDSARKFFAEQIHAGNDRARFALEYAQKRWGKEFVEIADIGFAPGKGAILQWGKENGFSEELLVELGLLKKKEGKTYDFYYNRIMMPILSRSNQTLGFTARVLDDSKPKYLNSPESIIFKKNNIIFGINAATRSAAKEDIIYLVEGAPDVYRLHSIGVTNTVASLGTAWSRKQFETLAKYTSTVCFIPDIDPTENESEFGPGIKAVMKNGITAIEAGLKVLVKEITPPNPGDKTDADSYIRTRKILDEILKVDFPEWYAEKVKRGKETASERAEAMRETCRVLALIPDKDYLKILSKRISKIFGVTTSMLQGAISEQVVRNAEVRHSSGDKLMDRELYSKYGFYERHNCYYSLNKDAGESQWSNFTLSPLFHIKDQLNPKRLFKITNESGLTKIIELRQQDLISLQAFKLRVEGLGDYLWEGNESQLTKLKKYLYGNTETATEVIQLGWQRDDFFAYGNGVVLNGQWLPADEFGIVRIPDIGNFYLPAASKIYCNERKLFQFERRFIHTTHSSLSFRTYTDKMIEVFGDNAKVGICFLLAALFKDIITAKTKNFPILNLFGPKGSGKSELGHSLMSFFIINNEPPNLSSATDAALADTVAQCANALVHIDEYKNTIELSRREFIKGLYDGVGRTRMNMDRDKKRETTAVDCGVILSGQEMPTIDIAIFSRLLYLTFNKTEFSPKEKRCFNELKEMRDLGCSHMVIQLLRYRKRVESGFAENYNTAIDDIEAAIDKQGIEDRTFRNWIIPLAIFRTLEGVIDVGFDYKEMLQICVSGIIRQNNVCKTNNELASFWQVVDYLHQNGDIFIDADYRIKYETSFKGKGVQTAMIFSPAKPILYLCTKRVMMLYRKNGKNVGESTLPQETLRHYLETSKEYIGIKQSVRFKNLSNFQEAVKTETAPNGMQTTVNTSRVDWALAFDYSMLVENFGINLEVESVHEDDIDPIEIDENDRSTPY